MVTSPASLYMNSHDFALSLFFLYIIFGKRARSVSIINTSGVRRNNRINACRIWSSFGVDIDIRIAFSIVVMYLQLRRTCGGYSVAPSSLLVWRLYLLWLGFLCLRWNGVRVRIRGIEEIGWRI